MHLTHRLAALALASAATSVLIAGCGDDSPDAASPPTQTINVDAAPAHVRWDSYQGIALPYGDDGPSATTGSGVVSGFTRTPQGAALAAIQYSTRIGVAPDGQWSAVLGAGAAPGTARDTFAVNRMQVSITAPVVSSQAPKVLGYTITDYNDTRTALTIYSGFPDASVAATDVVVVWSAGDWRVLLRSDTIEAPTRSVSAVPTEHFVTLGAPQ